MGEEIQTDVNGIYEQRRKLLDPSGVKSAKARNSSHASDTKDPMGSVPFLKSTHNEKQRGGEYMDTSL